MELEARSEKTSIKNLAWSSFYRDAGTENYVAFLKFLKVDCQITLPVLLQKQIDLSIQDTANVLQISE